MVQIRERDDSGIKETRARSGAHLQEGGATNGVRVAKNTTIIAVFLYWRIL
jgi:hypothetical protein